MFGKKSNVSTMPRSVRFLNGLIGSNERHYTFFEYFFFFLFLRKVPAVGPYLWSCPSTPPG